MGRSAELGRCDQVLQTIGAGPQARLLVVGDPGIGKSMLLDTVRRRALRRGYRVVRVVGVEGEDDLPNAFLDDVLDGLGAPSASAGTPVSRLSALTVEALARASEHGPVLLLLDDAQFADPASMAAVHLALRRGEDLAVGAILTSRPSADVEARFAGWPRLDLGGVDHETASALLEDALPDAAHAVVVALAGALGGNPLALQQIGHLLTGDQLQGREPLPDPLPLGPALHHAWDRRLDGLRNDSRRALLDLAVAGSRPGALAARDRTNDRFAEVLRQGLVRDDPVTGLGVAHPLLRAAVLGRATPQELADRHAAAARAAAAAGLPPTVVVHHLVRSCGGPDVRIAAAVEEQAERAERLERFHEAVTAWEAAARLSPSPGDRLRRALRGIRRQGYTQTTALRVRLLELVDGPVLDEEDACWVECLRADVRARQEPEAALSTYWSAVAHARRAVPQLVPAMLLETAEYAWTIGATADGVRAAREYAVLHARPGQDHDGRPPWAGDALLAAALFQHGDVGAATPLRRRAIQAARLVDPSALELDPLVDIVLLDDLLLDLSAAAGHRLLVAVERMDRQAEPQTCLWGVKAWRARARGDWTMARALVEDGLALAEANGDLGPELGMLALSVDLTAACSDHAVMSAQAQRLRAIGSTAGDVRRFATVDRALGLRALLDGRLDEAVSALTSAADQPCLGRGLRDGILTARIDLVETLFRAGETAAAHERCEQVLPLLTAMDEPLAQAFALRIQALAAPDEARTQELLAEAVEAHDPAMEPFERGRTLLLLGETLRRARQRTRAKAVLAQAVECFERLGATPWRLRAAQELRAAGGDVAAVDRPASGLLTAQELAVAQQAAHGRSNREAAASLCLSPRTVDYHLANVYRKLGLRGRGGLAHALAAVAPG